MSSSPWQCCSISIRSVITCFCVALILVTASVTLGVTYRFSLSAAEEIAKQHAVALAVKAKGDVEAFVNQPVEMIAGLQYMMTRDSFPLPSVVEPTNPTWYRFWWNTLVANMVAAKFAYQFALFGFNDGNYVGCKPLNSAVFQCRAFLYSARATTPGLSAIYQENYYMANYSLISSSSGSTTYDPRTRSWWNAVPHLPKAASWSDVYLSAMPTIPIVDINAAMFNASGTFLGLGSFTFALGELSNFLTSLQTTPNTQVFLLDNHNGLMASTFSVPYLKQTLVPANYSASLVPPGCVMSDVANGAVPMVLCRFTVDTYPYVPLQELAATSLSTVNRGTRGDAQLMRLGSEFYYVMVDNISTPLASYMGWRVVLLMPENDIIYGIVSGRNTAIYIVIGLLVVSSLIVLVTVSFLLSPLESLADHMYRVATFDESALGMAADGDKASSAESAFAEVRTIQEAFDTLTGELSKVKSYLPQSVLAALYGDNDDCGADDEGDVMEDEEAAAKNDEARKASDVRGVKDGVMGGRSSDAHAASRQGSVNLGDDGGRQPSIAIVGGAGLRSARGSVMVAGGPPPHRSASRMMSVSMGPGALAGASSSSAAPPPSLNTMLKLAQKKVTVLAINIRRFHAVVRRCSPEDVLKIHGVWVDHISRLAREHKGVFDSFSGDRFVITFNAVTSVGNHACAAAACALAIVKTIRDANVVSSATGAAAVTPPSNASGETASASVSCGISTSLALVGNMGTNAVKRFCVLGPCFGQALVLERMCKRYGSITTDTTAAGLSTSSAVPILLSGQSVLDTENFYELFFVSVLRLPGLVPSESKRTRVAALVGPKTVSSDEWMYQLEEGSNASSYGAHNTAFNRILFECSVTDAAAAKALLQEALGRKPTEQDNMALFSACQTETAKVLERVERQQQSGGLPFPTDYVDDMVDYFPVCIAG